MLPIKVLYVLLVVCTGIVLGVAGAIFWRVRRHLRASAEHALRLESMQQDQKAKTGESQ